MNKKKILVPLLIIPLIAMWSIVGSYVAAPSGPIEPLDTATFSVTPDTIIDETKQAPGTFSVNLTVADVTDLNAWQTNMTWDPAMLDYTSYTWGDFIEGNPNDTWSGGKPYNDATLPFTQQKKNATKWYPLAGNWTQPGNAQTSNNVFASCSIDGKNEYYWNFGISGLYTVSKLEVAVECNTTETVTTEQDKIYFWLSRNNGTTYGPRHNASVFVSEILTYYDVTSDFAWVPNDLINGALKIKIQYEQVGAVASKISLDWLAVRVTDTLTITNSPRAWDNNVDSYANFTYSQRDGVFNVTDFSHYLPYGGDDPNLDLSEILRVDFSMKYSATASASGDRYRIAYRAYVISTTPTILQPWTSAATPLTTFTWPNQPDPNDADWTWDEIAAITFYVETDRVGGDATAKFNEYEAWITVTYKRPYDWAFYVSQTRGYLLIGQSTGAGHYPGVDGSGLLCKLTFTIQNYGCTVLNITHSGTFLKDTYLKDISFTPVDGYFRNKLNGDSSGDGNVNSLDLGTVNGCWAPSGGVPPWSSGYDRDVDCNDDGWINSLDLGVVNGNWGRSYP